MGYSSEDDNSCDMNSTSSVSVSAKTPSATSATTTNRKTSSKMSSSKKSSSVHKKSSSGKHRLQRPTDIVVAPPRSCSDIGGEESTENMPNIIAYGRSGILEPQGNAFLKLVISKELFPRVKFLARNQYDYSTDPYSLSRYLCETCNINPVDIREEWWNKVKQTVKNKLASLRTQRAAQMKLFFMGTYKLTTCCDTGKQLAYISWCCRMVDKAF